MPSTTPHNVEPAARRVPRPALPGEECQECHLDALVVDAINAQRAAREQRIEDTGVLLAAAVWVVFFLLVCLAGFSVIGWEWLWIPGSVILASAFLTLAQVATRIVRIGR